MPQSHDIGEKIGFIVIFKLKFLRKQYFAKFPTTFHTIRWRIVERRDCGSLIVHVGITSLDRRTSFVDIRQTVIVVLVVVAVVMRQCKMVRQGIILKQYR